jgi:hypothetical protein
MGNRCRLLVCASFLLVSLPLLATESPDRGWYCSVAGGEYGVIEWNSKTYIAFGTSSLKVPLPLYPTLMLAVLPFGVLGYLLFGPKRKDAA